jgi:hypothetical protein
MTVQLSYTAEQVKAFEGQRADFGIIDIISKSAEGSNIYPGRAVVQGTEDGQAKLPSALGEEFVGITEYTTAGERETIGGDFYYLENKEMNVIDVGRVWVYAETSVTYGDKVFYRFTANIAPLDVIGRFRNNSDTGRAIEIKGAKFISTAGAGELALVWLPGPDVEKASVETFTATSGALSLETEVTLIETSAASVSTLAVGEEGQTKIIKMVADLGDMVLTPSLFFDGTTITFDDINDVVVLRVVDSQWMLISNSGAIVA